jgi:HlyD family secretion protein
MKYPLLYGCLGVCLGLGVTVSYQKLTNKSPWSLPSLGSEPRPAPTVSDAERPPSGRACVTALGRLEPEGEVVDISVPAGDRLDRLLVRENELVEAGQILAYLSSHAERRADRDAVASQLAEARERRAAETAYGEALIKEAELAVEQVQKLQPLDVQVQECKVSALEAEVALVNDDLARLTRLRDTTAAATQDYEHQVLLSRQKKEELAQAKALLSKVKLNKDLDLLRTQAQLLTARSALERAQKAQPVESLTRSLRYAEERLALTVIRAPAAGQVLKIRTWPGETTGTKPLLRMGNTAAMQALAEVYHTDARFVRVGQTVTVTSPALAEPVTGRVVQVGSIIFKNDVLHIDPTADVDARVVEVRIALEQNDLVRRLTYLQVNVRIDTSTSAAEEEAPKGRP